MKHTLPPKDRQPRVMDLSELSRLRQGHYRLFGASFLYPDEERVANLMAAVEYLKKATESLVAFPFLCSWKRMLSALNRLGDGREGRLQEEHVRLFLVNPAAPPYESFYLGPNGLATGWITADLAGDYADRGLTLASSLHDPPDHAAVELEFMSFLCNEEAKAWETANSKRGLQILKSEGEFLGQHLARWFPAFMRQLATEDREGFYAVGAEAAGAFIHHDRDLIALLLQRFHTPDDIC